MRRYLVVAHQTLGSPELLEAMRDQLAEGPCTFHLVVPEYHGGGLTWSEGEVRRRAELRLEDARLAFTTAGLAVSGEVGDSNPVEAVEHAIRRDGDDAFDGIIVSTLPHGISKWLGLDVPSRLKRKTGLDVRHIIGADVQDAGSPVDEDDRVGDEQGTPGDGERQEAQRGFAERSRGGNR